MWDKIKKRKWLIGIQSLVAVALVLSLFFSGVSINIGEKFHDADVIGIGEKTITIGLENQVYAAGTPDYACDGVQDNVQFQLAFNALPAQGGKIVVLAGNYSFAAAVTRAIDNVTVEGMGRGTYLARDGVNPIFTIGVQSNWTFINLRFDAGGVNDTGASHVVYENVWIGANYWAYDTSHDIGGAEWDIPSGRSTTLIVAASDAYANSIAQADYWCDGTADDVQINAAIAALPASVGTLQLTEGTFNLDAHIGVVSNLTIQGQGRTATSVVMNFTGDDSGLSYDAAFYSNADITDVTIRSLEIDGNRGALVDPGGGLLQLKHNGIWNGHDKKAIRIKVVDVYAHDFYGRGFSWYCGYDILVESCLIDTCRDEGIDIDHGEALATFDEEADVTRNNRVINNTVVNCVKAGIQYDGSTGNGGNAHGLIEGNTVRDCVHGIAISGATPVIVHNNTVIGYTCAFAADALTVTDNNFFMTTQLVLTVRNSVFTNNRFGGYTNSFVQLVNGSDDNVFDGNESYNQFLVVPGGSTADRNIVINHRHYGTQYLAQVVGDEWLFNNNVCERIETATTLAAGAAIGDTVLRLTDASNAFVGMPIDILQDDATTLHSFILEIAQTGYVVIYNPLTDDCALGNAVDVNPSNNRGIRIQAGSTGCVIRNNNLANVESVPLLDYGTGTIIENNIGYWGIGETRTIFTTVTWNGGSPQTVCDVADGYAVQNVWVEVVTTFDGAGATVDIGDGGNNAGFIPNATINLAAQGFYGYEADNRGAYLWDNVNNHERDYIYTGADTVDAFVVAGGGATQGEVLVTVQITRVGG